MASTPTTPPSGPRSPSSPSRTDPTRPGRPPAGPGRHPHLTHNHVPAGTQSPMTALSRHVTGLPRVPLAVLLLTLAIVAVGQVLPRGEASSLAPTTPGLTSGV